MANKKSETKSVKRTSENEKYLHQIFQLLKKRENAAIAGKKGAFNDTELRLLGEILSARVEGKRLISTQLASILGVTRSAISQIVNRLEARGVVKRVADSVDRKIAYIEATDEVLVEYEREIKIAAAFAGSVVKKYGVEKFRSLCELADEFLTLLEKEKAVMENKADK